MFCAKCGSKLSEDVKFCTQCGAEVGGVKKDNGKRTKGRAYKKKALVLGMLDILLLLVVGIFGFSKLYVPEANRTASPVETEPYIPIETELYIPVETEPAEPIEAEADGAVEIGPDGMANNLEFRLNGDGTACVIGIEEGVKVVVIPSKIKSGEKKYTVTAIENEIFIQCKNKMSRNESILVAYGEKEKERYSSLRSVEIPSSVTWIGAGAFPTTCEVIRR